MFRIYWIALAALGLIGFALPGWAQEAQGLPQVRPEIEEAQPAETGQPRDYSNQSPLEITIVETPEQADRSAERERNSDQHEASNLDAQIRSANAAERSAATAERQEVPAWVQIWLAIVGTIIAAIALVYTVVSNNRSERIAKIQVKAYPSFSIDSLKIEERALPDGANVRVEVAGTIQNFGQSPASRMSFRFNIFSTPSGEGALIDPNDFHDAGASANSISAGARINQMAARTFCIDWGRVTSGDDLIRFAYFITYEDVFGEITDTKVVAGAFIESPVGSRKYVFAADKERSKQ